ncbi:MAG: Cof-type HAD-IIB family hydrolase [Synergistaceae bacterium]|jgi:Cof subfamily protein (haloacid dehalogenase superfamily)|nr:Cof-type HAD-IIB family hydrolase [Synergistaceae bacterium]
MKLFVTDIDDTLSVGETVSVEVRRACARLRDAGWDIMIATGRTFGTSKNHMRAVGATQPAILYDGARTMTLDGREIRSSSFDPALAAEVLRSLWEAPVEIQIAGDEVVYCRESDGETVRFYREAGVPVHYVTETFIFQPFTIGPVYRIGLWVRPEDLSGLEARLRASFDGVEALAGGARFLDVLPEGVSKGSALDRFLADLPVRPEVIVAAGDHRNDLAMLLLADVAAVPRNAAESLLPLADIVIPSAAEHGVEALVDHLLSPAFVPKRKKKRGELLSSSF